ncbi:inositol polyphosphate-5-phosphatase A isoform X1 [Harmonia axyridis]|uniref:inositol polyphosphate-5-phosphatase A isoform X1 n=1 Tax=Harmonia axyridis TaxID=115357 RepID=UPI001E2752EF|nr:inositol polyphosphate-5-phosphatase A isoform X1 [Harmonia axyridis]
MDSKTVPILLVTANVGSIFEAPNDMLKIWCEEFISTIRKLDCKFIGLHCQEVGGKNYEHSMRHVEHFVKILMSSNELRLFDKVRVFLDEDYSSVEHFTALGNLYFIHNSIEDISIWDFKNNSFLPVRGKEIHSGNIESVTTKDKAKFPQDFFPECKWSRKGYLRTRWSLNGTVFDMVNIHLFHDASNIVAMETSPSIYSKDRKRALEHTLKRFNDGKIPYFLFGDFNFRTDTNSVVKKITEGLQTNRVQNNNSNDHTKYQYTNEDDKLILIIGKKEFSHSDLSSCKPSCVDLNPKWLKPYDMEVEQFKNYISEYSIDFPPSYPFEEDIEKPSTYMPTRCPSWCDRVLLSHTAKELISEDHPVGYKLMGMDICMGDHKPVYLSAILKGNAGTVLCCDHVHYECLPGPCQCCRSIASVKINITDMSDHMSYESYFKEVDSKLLHEPPITKDMLMHEPYTPESTESHSPMPDKVVNEKITTVPPNLLKSKLEYILESELKTELKVLERSKSDIDQKAIPVGDYLGDKCKSVPMSLVAEVSPTLQRCQPEDRLNCSPQEQSLDKEEIDDNQNRKKDRMHVSSWNIRKKCCTIS